LAESFRFKWNPPIAFYVGRNMDYGLRNRVEKVAKNKYEAVIVAARLARKINNFRLAEEEHLGPDAPLPEYAKKVTTEAIEDLAEGKVKYFFREERPAEEEPFPE
jgi:DNA-directed RNA polymerase omega subunit